ncbi:hypothetical protein BRADI_1g03977v3 [Brachypodium distachyon]|uniref:Uncharacterized protein n=1 Tax=Brachypodium distachyon TaxID=15368 RepID=A0A2K2DHZ6_BRADI|nr:hypothetical protein BRADI_1g03977v3 [Brachypodium distachyon]
MALTCYLTKDEVNADLTDSRACSKLFKRGKQSQHACLHDILILQLKKDQML